MFLTNLSNGKTFIIFEIISVYSLNSYPVQSYIKCIFKCLNVLAQLNGVVLSLLILVRSCSLNFLSNIVTKNSINHKLTWYFFRIHLGSFHTRHDLFTSRKNFTKNQNYMTKQPILFSFKLKTHPLWWLTLIVYTKTIYPTIFMCKL